MAEPSRPMPDRLVRYAEAGDVLERFLIAAAVAFLGIRIYLALTGYPQIGGGGLHVAHMLWGGLLMVAALVLALAFLGHRVRGIAAVVGGLGFGTFIDELGKFVTSDNNYFFRPAIALIYAVFVLLFLAFRAVARPRPPSPHAALVTAIDAVADAALRGFPTEERARALRLLGQSDPADPLVRSLMGAVVTIAPTESPTPSLAARGVATLQRWYERIVQARRFLAIVVVLLVLQGTGTAVLLVSEVVDDPTFSVNDPAFSFADGLKSVASAISNGLLVVGAVALRRSRLAAYVWFKRALLVSLFLVQFFSFYTNELAAAFGLFGNRLLLATLDFAIRRDRALAERPVPAGAALATAG